MYKFEEYINSNVLNATNIAKIMTNNISRYFDNEELLYNLRLIIAELMVNGVEHGNKCDCNKKVYLCVEIEKNKKIAIRVKDQGNGIECDSEKYTLDIDKTYGRGLFIVKKLTDKLIINKNEIVAELYL
ncbi:ATP-binding protein [Miniphocaeibacter massiliensis]|uniref:ATP-binding protein n=1 Tax=Miniphocaeibacter massiliensis TaxID=2041841 RepID=UPI0013EC9687|nr:ATP-binding protein [Miniphocaeibacter massiliensis]